MIRNKMRALAIKTVIKIIPSSKENIVNGFAIVFAVRTLKEVSKTSSNSNDSSRLSSNGSANEKIDDKDNN